MMASIGTNTSWPWMGPFWKGTFSGKWRLPMVTPAVSRGINAQVIAEVLLTAHQSFGVE